ncbi:MAG: thiopeptide-type bacteriocin biosynthesis protein [Acidobacteriota bacterium]
MRRLIDAVIDSFQPMVPAESEWSGDQLTMLTDLREQFLAAGAEHLERTLNPTRWLQMGLGFRDTEQRLDFLCGALRAKLDDWRTVGAIDSFWFMIKPPGLRLRFSGAALHSGFEPRLRRFLDEEVAAGRLDDYATGIYDAETYQFGGVVGLGIAHDLFAADSLTILELLRLETPVEILPLLSLTVLNDFLRTICLDGWEIWDAWCNLELAQRLPELSAEGREITEANVVEQREVLAAAVWDPDEILNELELPVRDVLRRALDCNAELAERLDAAARSGRLLYGPRQIFPFYAIFQWNRWNFSLETQSTLALYMQRLLDPRQS